MGNDGKAQFVNQDDDFFNNNSEALSQVMRKLEMVNQENDASERSKGKKVLGVDIEPPSFFLGLNNTESSQLSPSIANSKGLESMTTPEQQQVEQDMFDYFVQQPNMGVRLDENRREKRILDKLPSIFRSPFLANNEKLFKNFSKLQTKIADYAFQDGDKEEVLYCDNSVSINRCDMLTLSDNNYVMNNVIDAYVRLLNDENKKRSTSDLNRLFFKTNAFILLCTDKGKLDKAARLNDFIETLTNEMNEISVKKIDQFDLKKALITFFEKQGIGKIDALEKMKSTALKIPWQNKERHDDCGVYLLRHMQTYKGDIENWDAGFGDDIDEKLKTLRVVYCAEILLSNHNIHREEVQEKAKAMAKQKQKI